MQWDGGARVSHERGGASVTTAVVARKNAALPVVSSGPTMAGDGQRTAMQRHRAAMAGDEPAPVCPSPNHLPLPTRERERGSSRWDWIHRRVHHR